MSSYLHLIHIFIPFVLVFHYFSPSFYSGCVYLSTLLDFPTQIPVRAPELGWIVMAEKHFKKRSHFDNFLVKSGYTSLFSGAPRIVWMRLSYKEVNQFITFFQIVLLSKVYVFYVVVSSTSSEQFSSPFNRFYPL